MPASQGGDTQIQDLRDDLSKEVEQAYGKKYIGKGGGLGKESRVKI
jgi:hypothetical protein